MSDLIDRQAAISEIMEDIKDRSLHDDPATPEDYAEGYDEGIRNAAAIVIQMPSAQPECEDAVSRFEILRLIDYSSHDLNDAVDNRYMQNEIKQLPSVTLKQPGWIPCSTEMPPTGKDVLVTLEGGTVTDGERWEPQEGKWFLLGGGVNGLDEDVIAWMPLPAPWEGGQDNGTD